MNPLAISIGCTTSSVVPGYVVDSRITSWPRPQRGGDRLDRVHDVGQVGILGLAQRRRHADVDRVHVAELAHVGRRAELAGLDARREIGFEHVRDVALAGVDLIDLRRVDVEAGDVEAGARELDDERQADVAEADDTDARLARADPLESRDVDVGCQSLDSGQSVPGRGRRGAARPRRARDPRRPSS